jgi:hypothetical protein
MAIYHLHARYISRGSGSAQTKADYIAREGKYQSDKNELAYSESGHMPVWANENPKEYWKTADTYERANGRLCVHIEFALPTELSQEQQTELAKNFCQKISHSNGNKLPYSMAIHKGQSKGENNPHCHLMINERINDGIDRNPYDWFRRANPKNPATGGAKKTDELQHKLWLQNTRKLWAEIANQALEKIGHKTTIDHRTLAAQGIEREPQYHLGPAAAAMERKNKAVGKPHTERGLEYQKRFKIVELEKEFESLKHQQEKEDIAKEKTKKDTEDFQQWKANKSALLAEQKERSTISKIDALPPNRAQAEFMLAEMALNVKKLQKEYDEQVKAERSLADKIYWAEENLKDSRISLYVAPSKKYLTEGVMEAEKSAAKAKSDEQQAFELLPKKYRELAEAGRLNHVPEKWGIWDGGSTKKAVRDYIEAKSKVSLEKTRVTWAEREKQEGWDKKENLAKKIATLENDLSRMKPELAPAQEATQRLAKNVEVGKAKLKRLETQADQQWPERIQEREQAKKRQQSMGFGR